MNKKFSKEIAHVRSLMERSNLKMTYNEGVMYEKELLEEAERATDVNTLIEFLTKYNVRKGPFVSLAYIQLYPVDAMYPSNELHDNMSSMRGGFEDGSRGAEHFDKFMDRMQNTEWNSPTGRKRNGVGSFGKKIYPYILKLTRYRIHWQDEESYLKRSGEMRDKLNAAKDALSPETREALGIRDMSDDELQNRRFKDSYRYIGDLRNYGISTFAKYDDATGEWTPTRNTYREDPNDPNSETEYDRTVIKNIMTAEKDVSAQKPLYFGVHEDGSIDMIPKELGRLLHSEATRDVDLSTIQDEEQRSLAQNYIELEKNNNILTKQWLVQNVAYLCGVVESRDGVGSKYWVNPNITFLLKKTANKVSFNYRYTGIDVNELNEILEKYAKRESQVIENPNINGETIYADSDY